MPRRTLLTADDGHWSLETVDGQPVWTAGCETSILQALVPRYLELLNRESDGMPAPVRVGMSRRLRGAMLKLCPPSHVPWLRAFLLAYAGQEGVREEARSVLATCNTHRLIVLLDRGIVDRLRPLLQDAGDVLQVVLLSGTTGPGFAYVLPFGFLRLFDLNGLAEPVLEP